MKPIRVLAIAAAVTSAFHLAFFARVGAQETDISPEALQQIQDLLQEKESRTGAQRKLGSLLVYAGKTSLGQQIAPSVDLLPQVESLDSNENGVLVDMNAEVSTTLLEAIIQAGGSVISSSPADQLIRARIPLALLETFAARDDVQFIKPAPHARRSVGSLTTQGDVTHAANLARATYGVNGTGVRVGVLSDSAEATNFLIGTEDLRPDTTIVEEIIDGPGVSEGTAMMEIVQDLAPGAQLFFASAFNSPSSFATNIRTLRDVYHCDVIVDDVSWSDESPFQDGVIARAVNDVTASGAIYLSSAGNGGNLTSGNSSAWEGDFADGTVSGPYTLHDFGGQTFNRLRTLTGVLALFWSDPLRASANDYDLFVLNAAGTAVLAASTGNQTGTQDPFEEVFSPNGFPANSRVVIAKVSSAARRALHLDAFFGEPLQLATSGVTRGHNAGPSTVSVAAVAWMSARMGTRPFVGGVKNPTELFSSDGPRKMFYQADGTPITPGNLLFGTNGGTTFIKPDIAAADGVTTRTPGFNPFYGTSAAAPHAAGIAALVKAANPSATVQQIYDALISSALDIRAVGIDRDSGYGLIMAPASVGTIMR